jgi:hypothetical protein
MMKWFFRLFGLAAIIALSVGVRTLANASPYSTTSEYKIGDTLPKAKTKTKGKTAAPAVNASDYRKLNWDELLPPDWDPMKAIKGMDYSKLKDSDPRAIEALQQAKEEWDKAPVVEGLNGVKVNVAGFVVPLDIDVDHVKEFLIVPYFGACIHVPPPPSNQVIHIIVPKSISLAQHALLKDAVETQNPVEVSGVMQTSPSYTTMGASGYRITADLVEAYKAPKGQ